ncbi:hypothetical protein AMQ28_03540 [Acinetobacter sp. TTH0-4]|nr:hypothetical protein AMQ28_03540 [Acinetobacter sp. TTH0-4]
MHDSEHLSAMIESNYNAYQSLHYLKIVIEQEEKLMNRIFYRYLKIYKSRLKKVCADVLIEEERTIHYCGRVLIFEYC